MNQNYPSPENLRLRNMSCAWGKPRHAPRHTLRALAALGKRNRAAQRAAEDQIGRDTYSQRRRAVLDAMENSATTTGSTL